MGDYSSLYKYEKFEIIGDELVPLGIFSVDGNGTMPIVVKDDCDPQCGCPQPIYQWIQTEDTVCIEVITRTTTGTPYCSGDDLYADVTVEESIDDGDTWEVVSTTPTLVEEGGCASPEVQYRWVAIGTTCSNGNKYQNNVKQVSTDGGHTWADVVPAEYSASTLIESDSYDCGYRTSATTSATYCSNANQYVDVYSLVSRDYGVTWSTASTSTELIEEDVVECGFSARTISTATTCVGVDKHYLDEYQESRDTGTTWTTISSSTGSLIESQSTDCGYSATTVSSATYCSNANQYVDVYSIVSTDYGQTWTTASTSTVLVDSDVYECGYRTRTTTGDTYCSNANQYAYTYNEVSRDSGNTWTTASTSSVLVQSDSYDCGYRTGTTSSSTYCNGDDLYVDVYYRTSRDSGTTWTTASTTPTLVEAGGCATPTPSSPKFTLTLSDSSIVSAECDATSAISRSDISAYSASVTSAVIGDCTISIGRNAFRECASLTSVTIPNNVTNIDRNAFYICTGLTSISVPHSVTTIGNYAFSYCSSLTSCTIGSGVTSIGDAAFSGCTSLTSVTCFATTPPTLTTQTTYYRTFENTNDCPIYVPCDSVSAYKSDSRWSTYASRIEGIPVPSDYDGIYKGVLSNTQITTIIRLSGSTLTSGNVSSHRDDTIKSFVGTGVTAIDDNTFSGFTMLTEVNIASTVTSIGNNAFKDCPQMNVIIVNNTTPPTLGNNAFDGTNDCPIQVPCGYASTYKSASGWSTYASRII